MFSQLIMNNYNRSKIVICDIDGTLANIEHRRGYVRYQPTNWFAFNQEMVNDKVNHQVLDVYNSLKSQGFYMVIFTGRGNDYRDHTEAWLANNQIYYDELWMRHIKSQGEGPFEDGVSDVSVKQRMLNQLKNKHLDKEVYMAIDDRPKVVKGVWNKNNIFCFDVGQGASDF